MLSLRKVQHRVNLSTVGAAGALTLGLVWVGSNPFRQNLAVLVAMYSLLALGMYLPLNLGGALSLAYAAYLAIGGYSVALIATKTHWPVLTGYVIGIVVSGALAAALGLITRRVSGFHLAAVTLLFGTAFSTFLIAEPGITGGVVGLSGLRQLSAAGHTVTIEQLVIGSIIVVLIVGVLINRIAKAPIGITIRAMRDVPIAIEAVGVSVNTLRIVSLSVGAAVASVGGAVFATYNGTIGPDTFGVELVFLAIFMALLGGQATSWGAILGAAIVVEFTFNLQAFQTTGTLVFSVIVLGMLLVAPQGILGYVSRGFDYLARVFSRSPNGMLAAGRIDNLAPKFFTPSTPNRIGHGISAEKRRHVFQGSAAVLLRVQGLHKRFGGISAVNEVSFEVHSGEIVGLIGPNGAGKTTLVDLIDGTERADSGEMWLCERHLRGSTAKRSRGGLGRTFQHPQLAQELSVGENILLGVAANKLGNIMGMFKALGSGALLPLKKETFLRVEELGVRLGVTQLARSCKDITLGEQRVVEVCRVLAREPDVLLLDEPFAGSDSASADAMVTAVMSVADSGCGVILVDHNVDIVAILVDRIILLNHGVVVFDGDPDACLQSDEMREVYFGGVSAHDT